MQLISTASELEKQFKRLIKQYSNFSWATAWAGVKSSPFRELVNHKERVKF